MKDYCKLNRSGIAVILLANRLTDRRNIALDKLAKASLGYNRQNGIFLTETCWHVVKSISDVVRLPIPIINEILRSLCPRRRQYSRQFAPVRTSVTNICARTELKPAEHYCTARFD